MKVLFIILPIIAIAVGCLFVKIGWDKYKIKKEKNFLSKIIAGIVAVAVGALVLIIVPASIHQVESGQVAVVKVWGDAKEVKEAGIHFDFWLSHKYEYYDTTVQQTVIKTEAYSQDAQTMDIELVIQYQIQKENAMKIATNYGGLELLQTRIETIANEKMKSVLSQKSAMTIIETRQTVSPDVEAEIRKEITNDFYVNITSVVLTDISFSDAFEKTVEDKMIAEQEKLKAEYEKEKAIIQAEQALEVAKLNAEAALAQAKGEADALKAIAEAEANSVKVKSIEVARMLGFEIIETEVVVNEETVIEYEINFDGKTAEEIKVISDYLKYVEYLSKWDGKLPTVVTGEQATIMIPKV